jgi:Na+/H+-dicarboxylate symporter
VKTVFKKEHLFIRIAIGFGAGILLGTLAPQFSIDAKIIGDVYLNLIKMTVIPVLICAVMTSIINSANLASLRRVAVKTVLLYVVMFLASFAVAFGIAMLIRPGLGVVFENQPVYEGETGGQIHVSQVLLGMLPHSFSDILSAKCILPMLLLSILLSAVIVAMGERARPVTEFINGLKDLV